MSETNDKPKYSILKQLIIFIAIMFVLFFRVVTSTLSKYHAHSNTKISTQLKTAELVAYVKSIKPSPMRDGNMVVILKDLNGKEYVLSSAPGLLYGIREGDIADANVSLGIIDSIKLIKY